MGVKRLTNERGQALTETILLSWIMIVFFASAYQLFLASHTIFQSLTAVHQEIFRQGFAHNCIEHSDRCTYKTRPTMHGYVVWRTQDIPEIHMPVLELFTRFGMSNTASVWSHLRRGPDCPLCKKTQMGAGPAGPGSGPAAVGRLFVKAAQAAARVGNPALLRAITQRFNG